MFRRLALSVAALWSLGAPNLFARDLDFSPLADLDRPDTLQQVGAWVTSPSDSAAAPAGQTAPLLTDPPAPPQYVIRNFNHKEQVITGSIIMSCIALMMVTMNNYNPK